MFTVLADMSPRLLLLLGLFGVSANAAVWSAEDLPQAALLKPTAPLTIANQQCGVLPATQVYLPRQQAKQPLAMLEQWHQHPLASYLNCFSVETYSLQALQCEQQGERGRAHCQVDGEAAQATSYKIIFVPNDKGIAFNDSRLIVLPINASIGLFAHEVAHWLGFVDEYPMTAELAHDYCAGRYQHPSLNVVVTRKPSVSEAELIALWERLPWRFAVTDWRDLATPQDNGQWLLGSEVSKTTNQAEQVGLFPTQTCANTEYQAWRPVSGFTPMQYHDVYQWPAVYLLLLNNPSVSVGMGEQIIGR